MRHYKNDGPLATIEDTACAPCALQCVSRPASIPGVTPSTPKSLQEVVMGGAYTSTATADGSTQVDIQDSYDYRVMAKFAGAYALYQLGPAALCAEESSEWGGLLSSLGVPNMEGSSRPFWLRRLCTSEALRRRRLQNGSAVDEAADPRMGIPLSRETCADSQTPNGVCEDGGWIGDEEFLLADARRAKNESHILLGYDCSDCMTALMRQVPRSHQ